MTGKMLIKRFMDQFNLKPKDCADILGIRPHSFSNKLYKDNFTLNEFCKLADSVGVAVLLKKKIER